MGFRLGVDVGGTFTDLLLLNVDSGAFWRHKTPSTPHDSSEGILNGVTAICAEAGINAAGGEVRPLDDGDTRAQLGVLKALGQALDLPAAELPKGDGSPAAAKMRDHNLWMDGRVQAAVIYDRSKLLRGDVIQGPAIVVEMDSTTLIESGCIATVDAVGNILINPA